MQQDKGETSSYPVEGEASSSSAQNTGPPQEEMLKRKAQQSNKGGTQISVLRGHLRFVERKRLILQRERANLEQHLKSLEESFKKSKASGVTGGFYPSPLTDHLPESANMFPDPSVESIYKVPGEDTAKIQPFDANTPHGASSSTPYIHFPPAGLDSISEDKSETELIDELHKDTQKIVKEMSPDYNFDEKPLDLDAPSSYPYISYPSQVQELYDQSVLHHPIGSYCSSLSPSDKLIRSQSSDEIFTIIQGSSGAADPQTRFTSGFDYDITSAKKQGLVQTPTGSMGHQTQGEPSTAELSLPADSDPQQAFELFPETGENRTSALTRFHSSSGPSQTEGVFGLSGPIRWLSRGACRPPEQPQSKHTDHHRTPEEMSSSAYAHHGLPGCSLTFDSDLEQTQAPPPKTLTTQSGCYSDAVVEQKAAVAAVSCSVTNTLPIQTCSSGPSQTEGVSGSLFRSHSSPSLSHMTSAENRTLTRAQSLPDLQLNCSCEQFTPDITADEADETYRFQCSSPGLYQCSVTGLVFHMEREGDLVYRTLPWNRKLLSQHHKQPAGPLFDIKCEQQSVCQLHLPHCEIHSTGGADFLSVAHLDEENIEFVGPHKITETHVIINITGFSAFGNVKDEDAPPVPVQSMVLVFFRPPADPDPTSLLNVLLLPRNVAFRDVMRFRKKLDRAECYIEKPPDCKLQPQQEYSLSTCPEDDSVLVEPTTAEFDSDNYDNYFPSFQVTLRKTMSHLKLILRSPNSNTSEWEREFDLLSSRVQNSKKQRALNPTRDKKIYLLKIYRSLVERISLPNLQSLMDKMLEKKVMTYSEVESANHRRERRDIARFVIDTVERKGAGSKMIKALRKLDPTLSKHLGLE